tara:strand:- start:126 stop:401 length:276 start_codon:yes stop_codon:yes gene_type:complete
MIVTKKKYKALEEELKLAKAELNLVTRILSDSSLYIINVMKERSSRKIGATKALGFCETAALANLTFLEKEKKESYLNGTLYDSGRSYTEA